MSLIHELSGGRFPFGVGVSHAPMNERLGIVTGRPLADMKFEELSDWGRLYWSKVRSE